MRTPVRTPRRARRRWLLAGVVVVLVAGGVGAYVWHRLSLPQPPLPDLAGADPGLVEAVEAAREEVRASPRSAEAWGRLGLILVVHNYVPEAIVCFERAGRLDADSPRWPYLEGATRHRDDPDAALGPLRRAAELAGATSDAPRLLLAETLLAQGRFKESGEQFAAVLAGAADDPRARLGMARLVLRRGDAAEALSHLGRCSEHPSTRGAAALLRAEAHQRRGDHEAAGRALRASAALPPDRPWPNPYADDVESLLAGKHNLLGRYTLLADQGQHAQAADLLRQAEEKHRDLHWHLKGRQLLKNGNAATAVLYLRRAIELAPDVVEPHVDLGMALAAVEKDEEAVASFRRALRLEPSFGPAHLLLGGSLRRLGRTTEALTALRAAVRYMPLDAHAHRELGELLLEQGEVDEARTHLGHAVRLAPGDARARELLQRVGKRE